MEATASLFLHGHISEPAEHHMLSEQSHFALINERLLSLFNDLETHSCNCSPVHTDSHRGSTDTPQGSAGTLTGKLHRQEFKKQ